MSLSGVPSLWKLIDEALEVPGARKLHLAIGRPPMVRVEEGELEPLPGDHPIVNWKSIQIMLSGAVEPERWDQIEGVGEGECVLSTGTGRPVRLSMFRNSGSWSAVVHL